MCGRLITTSTSSPCFLFPCCDQFRLFSLLFYSFFSCSFSNHFFFLLFLSYLLLWLVFVHRVVLLQRNIRDTQLKLFAIKVYFHLHFHSILLPSACYWLCNLIRCQSNCVCVCAWVYISLERKISSPFQISIEIDIAFVAKETRGEEKQNGYSFDDVKIFIKAFFPCHIFSNIIVIRMRSFQLLEIVYILVALSIDVRFQISIDAFFFWLTSIVS